MNILRGTGQDGLSGMKLSRPLTRDCFIIRPLLNSSRLEIEKFCSDLGLQPRVDETNRELLFRRNRVRQELIPYLEHKYNPRFRESISRLSKIVSRENDFLEQVAAQNLEQLATLSHGHTVHLDLEGFCQVHAALQARMIRLAAFRLLGVFPRDLSYEHIQNVIQLCCRETTRGELYLPRGLRAVRCYNGLIITRQQPGFLGEAPFPPFKLSVPGHCILPGKKIRLEAKIVKRSLLKWPPDPEQEAYLDFDRVARLSEEESDKLEENSKIPEAANEEQVDETLTLTVRSRRDGDRFYPLGAPGTKKLKRFFIDHKVPREKRDGTPLVVAGRTIIWVAGYQVSELCRITGYTQEALVLQVIEEQ